MKYFGIPTCPYCRKRVNLIRTWSLKRQGEYQCPRCAGISNIFLSPLIYVFALLAIFSGGALYFFHKFVLDDVSLETIVQVLVPFAGFFLLSLFMVYLEKPVIKKVPKAEMQKGRRESFEDRRAPAPPSSGMMYDPDEYLPKGEYRTGTLPKIGPSPEQQRTSVMELPKARPAQPVRRPVQQAPTRPAVRPPVREAESAQRPSAVSSSSAQVQVYPAGRPAEPQKQAPVSSAAPVSASTDDFFAKYDDPEYVNRRLQEMRGKQGEDR